MKSFKTYLAAACVVLVLSATQVLAAGPVTLTYTNYYPETSPIAEQGWKPALRHITEKTDGQIVFKEYWAGTLHTLQDGFTACKSSMTDMTQAYAHTHGGMFDLMHAVGLPYAFPNPAVAAIVMEQLYPKYFKGEYEKQGVLLANVVVLASGGFISTKPVRTLDDMKGLRLFTGGGIVSEVYTALGAVPVNMNAADIFSAIQKGVIDGACFPKGIIIPRRLNEVAKYYTETGLTHSDISLCLNKNTFRKLSDPLKKSLYQALRENSWIQTMGYTNMDKAAEAALGEAGVEVIVLSPEEKARFKVLVEPVWDSFIEKNEKKGLPARAMVEDLKKLTAKYSAMTMDEIYKDIQTNPVHNIIDGM
jgi:TRAP-type C4-dicarboxylate transport system substrate-binding protein